jgi:hypothetical protein
MRRDEAAERAERVERKPRDFDDRKRRSVALSHPRRQQSATSVWTFDDKVNQSGMDDATNDSDSLSGEWMMRISDDNLKGLFLRSMSWARPASARVGLPARSATRPAGITARCCINGYRGSSMRSPSRVVMAVTLDSSGAWRASSSSSSTTGALPQ